MFAMKHAMLLVLMASSTLAFSPRIVNSLQHHQEFNTERGQSSATASALSASASPATNEKKQQDRQQLISFLQRAKELGPVGVVRSQEEQDELLEEAKALAKTLASSSYSEKSPASIPLIGVHDLIYSAAPGGSSGKLGPLIGTVKQTFVDSDTFINSVEFWGGVAKISLRAQRKVLNDSTIRVTFQETSVAVFGKTILTKELPENQGGAWKYLFAGVLEDDDGKGQTKKLIRIMTTPSLFVLEHTLEEEENEQKD